MTLPALPSANDDRVLGAICGAIAPLKIILKTKDDPIFLRDWIDHHAAIVGANNLIILDNGSSDEDVLRLYGAYMDEISIARFEGYYNDIHFPQKFPGLYTALACSSHHFLFLDTDERLAFTDGYAIDAGPAIVSRLASCAEHDFIPTTWLYCLPGTQDVFECGNYRERLKWGKPLMRSRSKGWPALINHNVHLRGSLAASVCPGFFVLHFAFSNPDQRIRTNVNKLIARGFASPQDTVAEIMQRTRSLEPPIIAGFLDEIERMQALTSPAGSTSGLRLIANQRLAFARETDRSEFMSYLETFPQAVEEILGSALA